MGRFLLRRLAGLLFVLVGVTFIVHLLIHLVPGDPVDTIVGQSVSDEDCAAEEVPIPFYRRGAK